MLKVVTSLKIKLHILSIIAAGGLDDLIYVIFFVCVDNYVDNKQKMIEESISFKI
jgi:hypothetical protein